MQYFTNEEWRFLWHFFNSPKTRIDKSASVAGKLLSRYAIYLTEGDEVIVIKRIDKILLRNQLLLVSSNDQSLTPHPKMCRANTVSHCEKLEPSEP